MSYSRLLIYCAPVLRSALPAQLVDLALERDAFVPRTIGNFVECLYVERDHYTHTGTITGTLGTLVDCACE